MKVTIETIPHNRQRYPTVGDWYEDHLGNLYIRVSEMNNMWYEHMVAIHEYWEWLQCKKRKISEEAVSAFDIAIESRRQPGDLSEPGDEVDAPYRNEHCSATGVERILCALLDIPWKEYEEKVCSL